MTTNSTFTLSQGETTTNTSAMTAKSGDYTISASFARSGNGDLQTVNVTINFANSLATLNQHGASQNLNYSFPATASEAQQAELREIFAEALVQIKSR